MILKTAKRHNSRKVLLLLILLSIFILGIGYAQITDNTLTISGEITSASPASTILITDIEYVSGNDINSSAQVINDPYLTLMTSSIELGNSLQSSITYRLTVRNDTDKIAVYKGPVYSTDLGYDNQDIEFIVNGITEGDKLYPGEDVDFTVTFKYVDSLSVITNQTLNSIINFQFDNSGIIEEYAPAGICEFNGRNNDIVGDCANNQHIDYIDTGISLFSSANHDNDFEIGFTIDNIDSSRFRSGKVDTVFDCLNDTTPYPGITMRIEDKNWYLQVGTGSDNKKLKWIPSDIESFVLRKVNNKVFYSINGGSFIFVEDLTNIPVLNNHLTIGTSLLSNGNPNTGRFLIADLSDIYARVYEPGYLEEPIIRTYETIDQEILDFVGENMTTAFSSAGQHTFDGTAANVINTGVELMNSTNYQKSFIVTFQIDEFVKASNSNQATLFNIKDESNSTYPGLMMRFTTSSNNYELAMKDGIGTVASVNIPLTAKRINIIKKGMEMYYQVDLGDITPLSNTNNFTNYPVSNTFTIPATFGCNINDVGSYDRMIVGKLSNMKIQIASS